ncbi:transporter substrate-binding domain-containing protein [Pseudorhodoferax sp. Leaf274]|uniref:transporter substrate-binding domain-containing protein n=1 Tax=Pseudorhodoferax sp. Leaf274 TaxID=1736318 RepID=UPI00138F7A4B|nr:transporter substrate-binding domain-containing protein [Pseudorhodoferax sp. Leaf274]
MQALPRLVQRVPVWLLALACAAAATAAAWALVPPEPPPARWPLLRIGVLASAMPLHSPTRAYTEEGHELTLARALGERLGVAPQFVALAPEAFADALAQGRVDAVLVREPLAATARAGTEALRTGYRSGTAAAMRSDTPLRRWDDLRGKTVCVSRAHQGAQALAQRAGARLQLVDAPAQALVQVRTGACDAALHDEAQLQALFLRKEWHKFSATLPAAAPAELLLLASAARPQALQALQQAVAAERRAPAWQERNRRWAANVAYEAYFDQIGPDCH